MKDIIMFGITFPAWIIVPIAFFLWVFCLFLLKAIGIKKLQDLSARTKTKVDDIFIKAVNTPLNLLIFVSGAYFIEQIVEFDKDFKYTQYFFTVFKILSIIAIIMFIDSFFRGLIQLYSKNNELLKTSKGIVNTVIKGVVYGLGLLMLLDSMGVSITPILASLGVGSLAVALALQPILENFFSGVVIILDQPIKVGQFIGLESGEEGYVEKIGWRSTWIRILPNNIIVMPNKKIMDSKIVNYYYPEPEMSTLVQVGVHYNSDLEKVERVTIEVGKEILKKVNGGVENFEPFIRYHTFDSSSINFSVILRVKEFVDNYLIKHEFIKALQKRYKEEGITIPFPIRAINYSQEKAE
ncbi:MAG: mechanosensitive ion channel family protein [Candidatus Omnitrophica bacterium]|nr:mechanosensitive ion channel family protein [Candidatus Omnitrophota bacterium]